jgi:tRNA1Val (adenine37-N6)-methyltransferase
LSNTFFSFKQFTIHQDRCAQKVSTDACLLGALIAERWKNSRDLLDIGAGTGLLMLMLAQKSKGQIQGIEIEPECYSQLQDNIMASPWKDRLTPLQGDVIKYDFKQQFDGIISNPPFFENDLPSSDTKDQIARHSLLLTIKQLFHAAKKWLKVDGELALLVPHSRITYCRETAPEAGLHLTACIHIRHASTHEPHRAIMIFEQTPVLKAMESTLTLMAEQQQYTPEALGLLKNYYLYL